jgi:hypothetical protein
MTTLLRLLTIVIYVITTCLYSTTIVMNFTMNVITTSHYSHLDYEFKILSMYAMNVYIIKYKKISALNFLTPFSIIGKLGL